MDSQFRDDSRSRKASMNRIKLRVAIATFTIAGLAAPTAMAQSTTTTAAAQATTAPTTTVAPPPRPAVLGEKLPTRPDCSNRDRVNAYAARLDALRLDALAEMSDVAVAATWGKELQQFVDNVRRAQHALPYWCKHGGAPTTTTMPVTRPTIIDDVLPTEPDCNDQRQLEGWIKQVDGYVDRLSALDPVKYAQWGAEIKAKMDMTIEMRGSLVALCNEKVASSNKGAAPTTKAQAPCPCPGKGAAKPPKGRARRDQGQAQHAQGHTGEEGQAPQACGQGYRGL